jgi:anti-sigma-K factor RskA
MDYSRPELADRLAAGYVSGVLRGPARRRFENLLPAHPALRRGVREWQDRLMPLTASIPPVQPSQAVWNAIQVRIGTSPLDRPRATPWWRRLEVWRATSLVTGVAAVALAVTLASPRPVQPPIVVVLSAPAPIAATANGEREAAAFVASISGDGRSMVTKPLSRVSLQADRSLELWALPPQGAPRSLGVISTSQATVVQRGQLLRGTDAFAVTLEPAGGSPSGAPTGPVLYVGKLVL